MRAPGGFGTTDDFNSGNVIAFLRPWEDRSITTAEVATIINKVIADQPGVRGNAAPRSGLGRGRGLPVNLVLAGATYEGLAAARDRIMPQIRELIATYKRDDLIALLDGTGLPFAPIARPEDMFDDPHLNASGGLEEVVLADGTTTKLPVLPIEMNGARPSASAKLAAEGADTQSILLSLGFTTDQIAALRSGQIAH